MKKRIAFCIAALLSFVLSACSGGDDASAPVEPNTIVADNLIIYDNGSRVTSGPQVLSASGGFAPAGPTVIYVVRAISERDQAALKRDRIKLKAHTAYSVPAETALTIDVLRKLKPIGAVDQSLSLNEVRALFGEEIESLAEQSLGQGEANRKNQVRRAELEEELEFLEASLALGYERLAQATSDEIDNLEEIESLVKKTETRYEELVAELQALNQ